MRTQWEILLWILCVNLAIGLCISLGVAGTEYVAPADTGVDPDDYEAHFNATATAEGWDPSPFTGIPVIGDIFGGFNFLWQCLGYLIDGLPTLIVYMGEVFITDATGLAAFYIIANAIRAVQAVLITLFLIEFISGRVFTD